MQRTSSIAAAVVLFAAVSGCGKQEPAAEVTQSAAAPVAATTWTPALPAPGAYDVTSSDGKPLAKATIGADYAYSRVPTKGLTEAGVVKLADGKVCFDPSGKDKPTHCYTESVRAADGSFTATDEKGVVVTGRPVAK